MQSETKDVCVENVGIGLGVTVHSVL